jgi:hypothetical protein
MTRLILALPVALIWACLAILLLPFAMIAAPFEIAARRSRRVSQPIPHPKARSLPI